MGNSPSQPQKSTRVLNSALGGRAADKLVTTPKIPRSDGNKKNIALDEDKSKRLNTQDRARLHRQQKIARKRGMADNNNNGNSSSNDQQQSSSSSTPEPDSNKSLEEKEQLSASAATLELPDAARNLLMNESSCRMDDGSGSDSIMGIKARDLGLTPSRMSNQENEELDEGGPEYLLGAFNKSRLEDQAQHDSQGMLVGGDKCNTKRNVRIKNVPLSPNDIRTLPLHNKTNEIQEGDDQKIGEVLEEGPNSRRAYRLHLQEPRRLLAEFEEIQSESESEGSKAEIVETASNHQLSASADDDRNNDDGRQYSDPSDLLSKFSDLELSCSESAGVSNDEGCLENYIDDSDDHEGDDNADLSVTDREDENDDEISLTSKFNEIQDSWHSVSGECSSSQLVDGGHHNIDESDEIKGDESDRNKDDADADTGSDDSDDDDDDDALSLDSNSVFSHSDNSCDSDSIGDDGSGILSRKSLTESIKERRSRRGLHSCGSTMGSSSRSIGSRSMGSSLAGSSRSPDRRKKQAVKPTAINAFETLPRHLIKTSMIRQAASTLRDERFLNRRITKLGAVYAAQLHVLDFVTLHDKVLDESKNREEDGTLLDAQMPSTSDLAPGEDVPSITLESFELFEKCVMDLCGIQMVQIYIDDDGDDDEENGDASGDDLESDQSTSDTSSSSTLVPSAISEEEAFPFEPKEPQIPLSEAGRGLYTLGKYCQKIDWCDDAMHFFKHALYLYFLDVGIEEPRLLDNSDDCDGFFYIQAARNASVNSSATNQYLGTIFTKMGDIHGKYDEEKNDALHAYKASQVFLKKYLDDKISGRVQDEDETDEDLDALEAAVESLALSYNRIGAVYTSRGDLESALHAMHEALEMQVEILGDDHIEVAKTLHNIGVCHRHRNKLDGALEFYQHAHEIFTSNLGRDHLDTVRTLHNIGGVHRRRKEYPEAMECFKEVLEVRRRLLGDNHPSVAITFVSIAAVLRRAGRNEEAVRFYALAMK
mmetsp:Transcript_3192/g.4702  ORF Transcript_3192/g.4702 Transcript_3192/m.4702 type:complete len:992 (-) Transcript_3192:83-3058(-)|eukprot:CAMPEP_0194118392 /NCGR_PEP_ID=MMETSP0150-20130528/35247_1 /TAXON_ID=122233 /ORGANISM="Chaetoceros debilis, Strain MM31A-1" /LENGTH=991 /DNA_ID=CAMNT_0038809743 /DNA_START=431 /DNA_END=3406 /DNA_ORIENTATION=+